jgi:hypothetical protein
MKDFTTIQNACWDARVAHGPDHPTTVALREEFMAHPEYSNSKPIMPLVGFDPYHNVPSDLAGVKTLNETELEGC